MSAYRTLIILLFCFSTSTVFTIAFCQLRVSYDPDNRNVEGGNVLRDFKRFQNTLIETHPSPYLYIEQSKLNILMDSCYKALNVRSTGLELLRSIKIIVSAIQDGHLYSGPSEPMRKELDEKTLFFPLKLTFVHDTAYVAATNAAQIPVGARVLSVNDEPMSSIQKKLFQLIPSDGAIKTKKRIILSNNFYFYYLLRYGEKRGFDIKYISKGGKRIQSGHLRAALKKHLPKLDKEDEHAPLALTFRNNIPILSVHSFDSTEITRYGQNFREFLDQSFKTIKSRNCANLIIDLRGNGGGKDIFGALLYSYLSTGPFRYYDYLSAATNHLPYQAFTKRTSSFNDLSSSMLSKDDSLGYLLDKSSHPNLDLLYPHKNAYTRKLWVLIDGQTFSTSAEFCSVAKSNDRAIFIGEETGGAYHGNMSGAAIEVILPFSGIKISIPTIRYAMCVKQSRFADRGIIPNYAVSGLLGGVSSDADTVLEFTLRLVGTKTEVK